MGKDVLEGQISTFISSTAISCRHASAFLGLSVLNSVFGAVSQFVACFGVRSSSISANDAVDQGIFAHSYSWQQTH